MTTNDFYFEDNDKIKYYRIFFDWFIETYCEKLFSP